MKPPTFNPQSPPTLTRSEPGITQALTFLYKAVYSLQARLGGGGGRKHDRTSALTMDEIRSALQVGGSHPLNITGLIGLTGQQQRSAPILASLPGPTHPASTSGSLILVGGTLYYYNTSTVPGVWTAIGGGGGGGTVTVQEVNVSVDPQNISAITPATLGAILMVYVTQTVGDQAITWEPTEFSSTMPTSIGADINTITVYPCVGKADNLWWPFANPMILELA